MPLNGRNYINLTLLQPGIAPSPNILRAEPTTELGIAAMAPAHAFEQLHADGPSCRTLTGVRRPTFPAERLGLDGIQEYRVITSSFSAEYGLLAGSQTVMVSKSGTNQFIGSVFDDLRNSALDAANYFDCPTAAKNFGVCLHTSGTIMAALLAVRFEKTRRSFSPPSKGSKSVWGLP